MTNKTTQKTLKITEKTHARLARLGGKGDTFDKIIGGLIDFKESK